MSTDVMSTAYGDGLSGNFEDPSADPPHSHFRNKLRARVFGREAYGIGGWDLSRVIRQVLTQWPIRSAEELSELIACACDGWQQARETGTFRKWREKLDQFREERERLEATRILSLRTVAPPKPSARSTWTVRATNGWEGNGR